METAIQECFLYDDSSWHHEYSHWNILFEGFHIEASKSHLSCSFHSDFEPRNKGAVFNQAKAVISKAQIFFNNLIEQAKILINKYLLAAKKPIKSLEQLQKTCQSVISKVLDEIPLTSNFTPLQEINLNCKETTINIQDWMSEKPSKIKKNKENSNSDNSPDFELDKDILALLNTNTHSSWRFYNCLVFFKDNHRELISWNFKTMKSQSFPINYRMTFSMENTSMCLIPNCRIFCYNYYSDFIIEQNNEITELVSSKVNYRLNIVYLNNFVYAIGGACKLAEKYNLSTNTWESCRKLPKGNYDNSFSAIFGNFILIVSHNMQKIVAFNTKVDDFYEIKSVKLSAFRHKFIAVDDQRAFIIEMGGNIYESQQGSFAKWKFVGSNTLKDERIPSFCLSSRNSELFITSSCRLIKFDLRKKKLIVKRHL
ncbi:unnamed protein product [Blepharisma stoltei]|uniref:BTB/POZ domain-containing protein n=1 Tax=Blepharisma stoltei TaxID=1481888 RepID=A0AAU9K793_9CILI|nr:unnamed protein product [Blepharisma stoltei]